MTHEELIRKIGGWEENRADTFESALIAIVELHKPKNLTKKPEVFNSWCTECSEPYEGDIIYYPCPTIQAIEKELQ